MSKSCKNCEKRVYHTEMVFKICSKRFFILALVLSIAPFFTFYLKTDDSSLAFSPVGLINSPQDEQQPALVSIPKILHHFWAGTKYRIPSTTLASCRELHPSWTFYQWPDRAEELNFKLKNQAAFDWYMKNEIPGAADVYRYEVVNAFGGVYLDADIWCLRPIDDLLTTNLTSSNGNFMWSFYEQYQRSPKFADEKRIANGAFGSTPGHPVLQKLIRDIADVRALPAWKTVGPMAFTNAINSLDQQDVVIHPYHVFAPYHYSEVIPETVAGLEKARKLNSYGVNLWGTTRNGKFSVRSLNDTPVVESGDNTPVVRVRDSTGPDVSLIEPLPAVDHAAVSGNWARYGCSNVSVSSLYPLLGAKLLESMTSRTCRWLPVQSNLKGVPFKKRGYAHGPLLGRRGKSAQHWALQFNRLWRDFGIIAVMSNGWELGAFRAGGHLPGDKGPYKTRITGDVFYVAPSPTCVFHACGSPNGEDTAGELNRCLRDSEIPAAFPKLPGASQDKTADCFMSIIRDKSVAPSAWNVHWEHIIAQEYWLNDTDFNEYFQRHFDLLPSDMLRSLCRCRMYGVDVFCFDSPFMERHLAASFGDDYMTPRPDDKGVNTLAKRMWPPEMAWYKG